MDKPLVIGIGEILWDVLPEGERLGGAPANFSYHAAALGAIGLPVSTVGSDIRGKRALAELQNKDMATEGITISSRYPTGYVEIRLDKEGIASYHFPDDTAWDHLQVSGWAARLSCTASAVCFGSLAQRSPDSRQVILDFLRSLPETALKVFDINLRQNYYNKEILHHSLTQADILKLNDEELPILARLFELPGDDRRQLSSLRDRYGLQLVILTRGAHGSLLLTGESISDHSGMPTDLVDTIGAGDSFTAAATVGFLLDLPLVEINAHANRLAAYVCGQSGAMPAIPGTFRLIR
ncbi:MAG: carbohydrate kinase [Desulfoprunum sp.]|nr:carbohydrate kinase [Desulfoprunum sp.]